MNLDGQKVRILMVLNMAQALKKKADASGPADANTLIGEYIKLSGSLISTFPDASDLLPKRASVSSYSDVKYAIDQLNSYVNAKAIPLFPDFLDLMRKMGLQPSQFLPGTDPLSALMPILNEWGLDANWVIGASALALIEVMVNKKLEQIGLGREGNFETRFKRLSLHAKGKGIKLPDLLAGPFYGARSKVIHEGKEPTPEELKIVLEYLALCSRSLKGIQ